MIGEMIKARFAHLPESVAHPHVPEERALLYSSLDGGSTEIETLNFLSAAIYSWKPKLVIETGVFRGFGTIAIASALKANGFGKVYSIEIDPARIEEARKHMEQFDPELCQFVEFVCSDSLAFIDGFSRGKFDLAFLDSETWLRAKELEALRARGLLSAGAVVMLHDTSRHREDSGGHNADLITALDAMSPTGQIEFPFSRGFRFMTF